MVLEGKSYAITREEGVLKNGFWVMLLWYSNILNE